MTGNIVCLCAESDAGAVLVMDVRLTQFEVNVFLT